MALLFLYPLSLNDWLLLICSYQNSKRFLFYFIAMFVTVRGIDRLGEDFVLPTCPKFYNIFHPYDPVAYRFETLIDVNMVNVPPVLIPHHKGRKRMHIGNCVMAIVMAIVLSQQQMTGLVH